MRVPNMKSILLLAVLLTLLIPAAVSLAGDKEKCEKKSKHFVIGDEYESISIDTDGSEMTVTLTDDGDTKITVLDMEQVGFMVGETMSEVVEALSEMQMELRVGNDNSFSFAIDDEEWDVDIDEVMNEVGEALTLAFENIDTDEWSSHRNYRTIEIDSDDFMDDEDMDELHDDLDDLREELKDLKRELKRLKRNKRN